MTIYLVRECLLHTDPVAEPSLGSVELALTKILYEHTDSVQ